MNNAIATLIRARVRAKVENAKRQGQLLDNNDDFHETIRIKLQGLQESNQFYNFSRCGSDEIFRTCRNCGKWETFEYRCNLKWCPRCQQRLSIIRKNLIGMWAKKIAQPKHLVLTHRNFPTLTRRKIREHTRDLARMRRSKCFREVRGGCVSTEITNEQRGWHLHAHLLIDVTWLDMPDVSRRWGKICGQEFAIVKIKDVRDRDYLHEICKYIVEGSELAKWKPDELNEFVQAVKGVRMFNSFGSLRDLAPQIRKELFSQKPDPPMCDCGSMDYTYEDQTQVTVRDAEKLNHLNSRCRKHPAAVGAVATADAGAGEQFLPL